MNDSERYTEKESKAEKYENSREHFRNQARTEFLRYHKKANLMVAALNEVVARHIDFASGKDFRHIENGDYYSKLITSFTRTHFVLYDLIICNELTDASVLYRKQLELVSRLVELQNNIDPSKLFGKTPNVKHLEFDLNRLYSDYSELSHSSSNEKLGILGTVDTENGSYTSVYPVFSENSYVSFYHLFLLVTQYHYWIAEKYEEWFDDYSSDEDCKVFKKSFEAMSEIFYKNGIPETENTNDA